MEVTSRNENQRPSQRLRTNLPIIDQVYRSVLYAYAYTNLPYMVKLLLQFHGQIIAPYIYIQQKILAAGKYVMARKKFLCASYKHNKSERTSYPTRCKLNESHDSHLHLWFVYYRSLFIFCFPMKYILCMNQWIQIRLAPEDSLCFRYVQEGMFWLFSWISML